MISKLLTKLIGSRNDRTLKSLRKIAKQINTLEPRFEALSDEELSATTDSYRTRLAQGESLDALLPEAFATVREASRRVFGMRHFDVQLIGGMVLNANQIAEMKTGEGKTLTATLSAYLNALTGKGVHVITVNDYLAKRDAAANQPLFNFLGITVGCNLSGMTPEEKRAAYAADITYGTNNEFGFDYLRDNMAFTTEQRVQRPLYYALVDEVDSVLIDEARTPLIISGPAEDSSALYQQINTLIPALIKQDKEDTEDYQGDGDFTVDEKNRQVHLTENGQIKVEELLKQAQLLAEDESLFSANNIGLLHHTYAALKAHVLFERNVDYIVQNNEVIIVDEHTGRTMPGRRWSDGLHQAIEAKEHVNIQNENQTLASITFQNYFRIYEKLAGMTGTADTEAYEFQQIYGLETVVIPTNRPMQRQDHGDLVYLTATEKYNAIVKDIKECVERGQPVLVGTVSIENSELLATILTKEQIPHQVLNAKFHEKEADIIAQAGRAGAVTIATNMAGRGTDIVLGGSLQGELAALDNPSAEQIDAIKAAWQIRHDAVLAAGGLHIIGTERHESRRIDNQLRGRAGRQGDAGSSRFYLSMEDSLMRIFASERVSGMMKKLGMAEGEAIEHPWVTKAIENAQRKVEGRNFDVRKNLLEFDDVANDQRKVIYEQRNDLLEAESIQDTIDIIRDDVFNAVIDNFIPPQSLEDMWDVPGLTQALQTDFGLDLPLQDWLAQDDNLHEESLRERILSTAKDDYRAKEVKVGEQGLRQFEKNVMLQTLDHLWKEHLAAMDYLRQGIHLRGYAQKNPKQEYKSESFELFKNLLDELKHDVIRILSRVQVEAPMPTPEPADGGIQLDLSAINRNDPCPCGSEKKFKHCHGQLV